MKIIRLFPFLICLPLLAACGAKNEEAQIKAAIDEANYCETSDDCVLVGSKCPFDCYIYANEAEADRIRDLVDNFDSQCAYSCIASEGVRCQDNKCVPITEQPQQ